MKKLLTFAGALALLSPMAANAGELPDGVYFEGRGGLSILQDADNDGDLISIESEFDRGYAVEGAFGFLHRSGFRGEVAIGYRRNDIDELAFTNDGGFGAQLGVGSLNGMSASDLGVDVDGHASNLSGMANGIYEFQTGSVRPFLGAGLGISRISAEADLSAGGVTVNLVDDSDVVLAYQAVAGVVVDITENVAATGTYSYMATTDPSFDDSAGNSFDSEYQSHNVMVGIRVGF